MKTLDELRAARDACWIGHAEFVAASDAACDARDARDAALDVYYDESRVPVDAGDPRRVVREAAYEAYKSASDAYLTKLEEIENENTFKELRAASYARYQAAVNAAREAGYAAALAERAAYDERYQSVYNSVNAFGSPNWRKTYSAAYDNVMNDFLITEGIIKSEDLENENIG